MLGAGMPKEPQLHPMEVVAGSGSWSRSWSRFGPCESRWALARATLQPNTKVQMQEATLQPNTKSYAHGQYARGHTTTKYYTGSWGTIYCRMLMLSMVCAHAQYGVAQYGVAFFDCPE